MSMVLIDGKEASPEAVDPAKHRFLGMFRPAADPLAKMLALNRASPAEERWSVFHCNCGEDVWHVDNGSHWKKGCFDVPQYQTIQATSGY